MAASRRSWTAADYESQEILHQLGCRDAVARVSRARRGHPLLRAVRAARQIFAPLRHVG
ncbi:hypothetical protein [Streptomyces niveus]|uniref:hypothetical protein n=1 Tax=Streptomyces niveus TaxID=193462 RepID=UPI0036D21B2C